MVRFTNWNCPFYMYKVPQPSCNNWKNHIGFWFFLWTTSLETIASFSIFCGCVYVWACVYGIGVGACGTHTLSASTSQHEQETNQIKAQTHTYPNHNINTTQNPTKTRIWLLLFRKLNFMEYHIGRSQSIKHFSSLLFIIYILVLLFCFVSLWFCDDVNLEFWRTDFL